MHICIFYTWYLIIFRLFMCSRKKDKSWNKYLGENYQKDMKKKYLNSWNYVMMCICAYICGCSWSLFNNSIIVQSLCSLILIICTFLLDLNGCIHARISHGCVTEIEAVLHDLINSHIDLDSMMTSGHGHILRNTGPLVEEPTVYQWIPSKRVAYS